MPSPWVHNIYASGYPETDERKEVQDLLQRWPALSHYLDITPGAMFTGLEEHVKELGLPEGFMQWFAIRQEGLAAHQAGIRLILSGEAGNFVLQSSQLRLIDLLKTGNVNDFWAQLKIWREEYYWYSHNFFRLGKAALGVYHQGLWHLAKRLRFKLFRRDYSLPYVVPSLREVALDLEDRVFKEVNFSYNQEKRCGLRHKLIWLEHLFREIFPTGLILDLEGVVMSTPFLDRRVVKVGMSWMAQEEKASSSRELLGQTLERTVGHRLPPSFGDITRFQQDSIQNEVKKGGNLFKARTLVDLGIVDRKRLKRLLAEHIAGQGQFRSQVWWSLASMEAWAQGWLA